MSQVGFTGSEDAATWVLTCLPRARLCRANTGIFFQHLISLDRPIQLSILNNIRGSDRFQAFTTMIAVQLLATCFTLPPESERCPRPPASYYDRSCPIGPSSDPRLISSLRLHTHFRNSPALGHNARNSSPALAWPGCRNSRLLEDRLAEEISRQRRIQQLERPNQFGKDPDSSRGGVTGRLTEWRETVGVWPHRHLFGVVTKVALK